MAEIIAKLTGETVISSSKDGGGEKVATSSLCGNGKVIGLYLSANWCPPCRVFTPKLAALYEKVRASVGKPKQFEVIFISYDRDLESFADYFKTMPWHAMDFKEDDPEPRESLMDKFNVQGIPSLILLDGNTGKEITRLGREEVERDPEGRLFPWRKK